MAALAGRSARQKQGLFLAEGPQPVREALTVWLRRWESGTPDPDRTEPIAGPDMLRALPTLDELYYDPASLGRHSDLGLLLERVRSAAAEPGPAASRSARPLIREATPEVLRAVGDAQTSQGMIAVCRFPEVGISATEACADSQLAVAMLRVQDPGNAGTVIRTADAAGASAVLLVPHSVDPWSPKVVRSAAGSHFHVPLVSAPGPQQIADAARAGGLQVLAAHGGGATELTEVGTLTRPTLWLMGNEAQGLSAQELEQADSAVAIPIYGQAESLNVATAATICLYASAMAQHRVLGDEGGR